MRGARTIPGLKAVGDAEALGLFSLGVEVHIASSFATLSRALARVDVMTMKGHEAEAARAIAEAIRVKLTAPWCALASLCVGEGGE
jgi:hypothetical protein